MSINPSGSTLASGRTPFPTGKITSIDSKRLTNSPIKPSLQDLYSAALIYQNLKKATEYRRQLKEQTGRSQKEEDKSVRQDNTRATSRFIVPNPVSRGMNRQRISYPVSSGPFPQNALVVRIFNRVSTYIPAQIQGSFLPQQTFTSVPVYVPVSAQASAQQTCSSLSSLPSMSKEDEKLQRSIIKYLNTSKKSSDELKCYGISCISRPDELKGILRNVSSSEPEKNRLSEETLEKICCLSKPWFVFYNKYFHSIGERTANLRRI